MYILSPTINLFAGAPTELSILLKTAYKAALVETLTGLTKVCDTVVNLLISKTREAPLALKLI